MIRFGPYELEPTQGLRRDGHEIRLTPRSLAVLWHLAARAGRVVSKDDLFESVWADVAVTDSALATCIQEIRHALDDDARQPRYIETIHRRGYRFVASTQVDGGWELPAPPTPAQQAAPLLGRDREVAAVVAAFDAACRGTRQVCFISGEPGIGKTAVFEASLAAIAAGGHRGDSPRPASAVTRAQCIERYGSGEPYQPLLDALMRLCRQPGGASVLEILERFAPMWLAQLPGLLPARQFGALQRTVAGASPDRMLRELTYAVEAIAERQPLVIGIEDVHWSDPSTLDWIATVAPRTEPARLLIVATTRPERSERDTSSLPDALNTVWDTLRAKHLAIDVPLAGLDGDAAVGFVAARLPSEDGAEQSQRLDRLARRIWAHTAGNPLFMTAVLDQLVERRVVTAAGRHWRYAGDVDVLDLGVPETIRPIIDRQIERLTPLGRSLLETASVMDDRFSVSVVADATGADGADAEEALGSSASRRFVRAAVAVSDAKDGSAAYSFVHALYRGALYDSLPPARRRELHRRVGESLEGHAGDRAHEIAAQLALHFELGRDLPRAVAYLQVAGDAARRRSAYREALAHYERARSLLARLPGSAARDEAELNLLMGIGASTMATSGFGAPEVEAAYAAARSLSQRIGDTPRVFPALWGQWLFYWGRGTFSTAEELAAELRTRAIGANDAIWLQALHASWATTCALGRFAQTTADAAEGVRIYDAARHAEMASMYGSHDPGVCAHIFAARALALIGRVDEAVRHSDQGLALARSLSHPFSMALSLTFRAVVDLSCRDPAGAAANAAMGRGLADEQGFKLLQAWCTAIGGWAAAQLGDFRGVDDIERAVAAARTSGSDAFVPFLLGLLAEGYLNAGRSDQGMTAVDDALTVARRTGERFHASELHRLRGDLLLAAGGDPREAVREHRTAVDVAAEQGAALLRLRAAVRLARGPSAGTDDGTRELLREARRAVPGAPGVPDLEEADELLASDVFAEGR